MVESNDRSKYLDIISRKIFLGQDNDRKILLIE
jgi:hypothetical protein